MRKPFYLNRLDRKELDRTMEIKMNILLVEEDAHSVCENFSIQSWEGTINIG